MLLACQGAAHHYPQAFAAHVDRGILAAMQTMIDTLNQQMARQIAQLNQDMMQHFGEVNSKLAVMNQNIIELG